MADKELKVGFPMYPNSEDQVDISPEFQEGIFGLLTNFRDTFRKARDFQDVLTQIYFGQRDDGYQVSPENNRKVELWRGSTYWAVTYSFTENLQDLFVERNTKNNNILPTMETFRLQSKRFVEQTPYGRINYFKQEPPNGSEQMVITRHRNDPIAARETLKALQDFQSGN